LPAWTASVSASVAHHGHLHAGHITLVEKARSALISCVCQLFSSIPLQSPQGRTYSFRVTSGTDQRKVLELGAHPGVAPNVNEMYPHGYGRAPPG